MIMQGGKHIKISVLMPVYNGERYLREAIESILSQSLTDFEFLIINDGSTDNSIDIINSYSDHRIRLVQNETNLGLIATLNKGINLAQGEYIARMDCDDISLSERLEKQYRFMECHPDIGICGTWLRSIGDNSGLVCRFPTDPEQFRAELLFDSIIGHPSVMLRKSIIEQFNLYYDPTYCHAEDYDLWSRAVMHCKICSIPEMLVLYRYHSAQVSQQRSDQQKQTAGKVRLGQLRSLGVEPTPYEFSLHQAFGTMTHLKTSNFFTDATNWLVKLKKANAANRIYIEPQFSLMLCDRWFRLCLSAILKGRWTLRIVSFPKPIVGTFTGIRYAIKFIAQQLIDFMSKYSFNICNCNRNR